MGTVYFLGWAIETLGGIKFSPFSTMLASEGRPGSVLEVTVPFLAPGFVVLAVGCDLDSVILDNRISLPLLTPRKCVFTECVPEGGLVLVTVKQGLTSEPLPGFGLMQGGDS